jgi:hypothetical protein
MPRTCSICSLPQRIEIETVVLGGTSIRSAAKVAGVSGSALQRHFKHLPAAIAKSVAGETLQIQACGKLPARIEELIAQTRHVLESAKKKSDFHAALAAIRANLSCLEMLGKISGELRPGGAGEFVPGTAAAAASVTVNMPAPKKEKTWADVEDLMRQIYNLGPKREPKIPPIM